MGGKSMTMIYAAVGGLAFVIVMFFVMPVFLAPIAIGADVPATCESSEEAPLPPGGGEGTVRPVDDIAVSSPFGPRWGSTHHGTDYEGGGNGAPMYAFAEGVVSRVQSNPGGYGNYIVIDHKTEDGEKYSTLYGHMFADQIEVSEGDNVQAGQGIARVGWDGHVVPKQESSAHLHFEYHPGGYTGLDSAVDPHPYVEAAKPASEANNPDAAAMRAALQRPKDDPGDGDTGDDTDVGGIPLPKPNGPGLDYVEKAGPIPENYLTAYKKAEEEYDLPWQLLAGIGWVETRHGTLDAKGVESGYNDDAFPDEPEGCCAGPMQFNANPDFRGQGHPTTWDSYATDGNGDGVKNVYDIEDAGPSAAKKLIADGVKGGSEQAVREAILAYNNLDTYVNSVLESAWVYAEGEVPTIPGEEPGQCDPEGPSSGDNSHGTKGADPDDLRLDWPEESATVENEYDDGKITPRMAGVLDTMQLSGIKPTSIGCYRDPAEDEVGDHSSGVGCDLMFTPANTPKNVNDGWIMANFLVAHQKDLGIKYLIWQGKIWSATNEPENWRPYESEQYSCPDESNITGCHYDHIHVTVF